MHTAELSTEVQGLSGTCDADGGIEQWGNGAMVPSTLSTG